MIRFELKINSFLNTFLVLFFVVGCTHKNSESLKIATAANMQYAMKELTTTFSKQTGINCDIIVSSSGKLTAQIKEGAPYDIFASADMKFPNVLFKTGYTYNKPKVYAFGKLIMWTFDDDIQPNLNQLQNTSIKHIAVANPKTAPYGTAAHELLKKEFLFDKIKHKFVYGESVAQTNQFITTMAAEVGFTAKSVVFSPQMKGKGNWIDLDDKNYTPISQGIVILKNDSSNIENAKEFYNFIFSVEGKEILMKYGYSIVIE